MKRVLGLDLGTNSIGWAVIDCPSEDDPVDTVGSVVAMGSRVYTQGAEEDGKALTTPAKERRQKRSMRRQIQRRARRRQRIRSEITELGLLPEDQAEFDRLMDVNPHGLLDRSAAGEQLSLREVGRVVYWFSSKRGFSSLRSEGANLTDDDDDRAARTRYRHPQVHAETGEIVNEGQEDVLVGFLRQQAVHYPDLITDRLIFGARGKLTYPVRPIKRDKYLSDGSWLDEFGIHGLVFFQRSVYWDEKTIGKCSLDPEQGGVRALRADRLAQKFRVWKVIVDFRVGNPGVALDEKHRRELHEILMNQGSVTFGVVRKELGLAEDAPINFERSRREGLKGNETDAAMRKAIGKEAWAALDEDHRDRLVHLLLGDAQEPQVKASLAKEYGLDDAQISGCLDARFPGGRAMYGKRTLRRLLAVMPDHDTERDTIDAAGYRTPEEVRKERPVDLVEIANPLVRQTLSQLRKVLHAVAHAHGNEGADPFDVVRIELSRDVRANYKRRQEINDQQRKNEKENEIADELIADFGQGDSTRDQRRRARLWRDQGERCLYCGQPISARAALSADTELDHIVPRSRSLDDSMANMALVHTAENRDKGDRTVIEWRGEEASEEIAERAWETLPWQHRRAKVRRIKAEGVEGQPVPAALLVITGYINSVARDFVRQELGVEPQVSSGRITRQLLYRLGLHKDDVDHRRHALDAAAIALCDIRTGRALADRFRQERDHGVRRTEEFGDWEPWPGLKAELEACYAAINVSHVVAGKVSGQWHEETRYGEVDSPHIEGDRMVAVRRPLSAINSPKRLAEVADLAVRQTLTDDLVERGKDPEAKKLGFDEKNPPIMADGSVIKAVRCHLNRPGNRVLRPDFDSKTTVAISRMHCALVYENRHTGEWRYEILPRIDAYGLRAEPLDSVRRTYAEEGEKFLFSATAGTSILLDTEFGKDQLFVAKSLAPSLNSIDMRLAVDSGQAKQSWHRASKLKEMNARKVTVLPSGEIRTARD